MSTWIWGIVLLVAATVSHWGAERLAKPLHKLTRRWGLTAAAGGALVALVTAGSEVGINTTSALRDVTDIGLGMSLGSNVLAIPLTVTVVYLATRKRRLGEEEEDSDDSGSDDLGSGSEAGEGADEPRRHVEDHFLPVAKETVTVLTLPAPWRGLQPIDAVFLLAGYALYLAQALKRGKEEGEKGSWSRKEVALAVAGVAAMGVGAYFVVRASENIASGLGLSEIVTGLFITALATALPELFGAWSIARSGQVTAATSSVIGDHAVTMTVALVPLALVTLPIEDLRLFSVNLAFVALLPAVYAALIHWGSDEHGFTRGQVVALDATYLVYLAVMFLWVL
jgi:cation:H+ antiporter